MLSDEVIYGLFGGTICYFSRAARLAAGTYCDATLLPISFSSGLSSSRSSRSFFAFGTAVRTLHLKLDHEGPVRAGDFMLLMSGVKAALDIMVHQEVVNPLARFRQWAWDVLQRNKGGPSPEV